MPIRDGRVNFGEPLEQVVRGYYARIAEAHGVTLPSLQEIAPVPALPAEVNHGRWIVRCPDCRGAEFVWLDNPVMMCMSCFNAAVGGAWRRVQLPGTRQRAAIERALMARPDPQTRNWVPGETVAQLQAENLRKWGGDIQWHGRRLQQL